ncbi:MAG: hypothetical protein RL732_1587 [Bacteroidota bacterium]|jgi:cellulose synthase/poly-beta-1,6-N-acetylglucosamine synthase-like glycosyltransferase
MRFYLQLNYFRCSTDQLQGMASTSPNWPLIVFIIFCIITFIQLVYYWGLFSRLAFFRQSERKRSQQHPVSIIVCARDEAPNLARNLPGLFAQTYKSSHEVIVVNHNSQDDTRFLLEEFKKSFRGLIAINLEQEAKGIPGKKYPLSIGIKEARYEILLLTDADCVPASEFWIQRMQDAFEDKVEIVLGYGSFHKRPGILNKLIRFDTFHNALQYLSYALAGIPYMGVGRNLSYKRALFFDNKGFSSINHIAGGDDDLFINKVATPNNTAIVIDKEAFTLSEAERSLNDWIRQKNRHFSTARYYKPLHKMLLGTYSLSQFLYYPILIANLVLVDWKLAAGVFSIRFLSQAVVLYPSMKKLNESDLFRWWWLLDLWMFFYYLLFTPVLWRKPSKQWR